MKDFALVSQLTVTPNMLVVHNAVPAKNVQELVKLARARPGELTFASGGSGTGNQTVGKSIRRSSQGGSLARCNRVLEPVSNRAHAP